MLSRLPRASDPNLIVGTEHSDDAGVYRLNETTALVQTVDFFPPLVDDPFMFGQIAAANSLSDVYAMGGRPLTVLNIVGFPDNDLPGEILEQILAGGAERVAKAGAVVVGGHTVRDAEIKFGLSVTGLVHPDRVVTNAGANPGDLLVLTKPLGSGILTTAFKMNLIAEADLAEAVEVMIDLNAAAAEAMNEVGVNAATDITGFGLIGHAFEMAEASGVTIEIEAATVPIMGRVMDLAAKGCLTRAHRSNLAHLGTKLAATGVDSLLVNVLADAQTSGGLLISVRPQSADWLADMLRQGGCKAHAVIGRVLERQPVAMVLR